MKRLSERATRYVLEAERAGVANPRRMRHFALQGAVTFAVGLTALIALQWSGPGTVVAAIAAPVLGLILGGACLARLRRASAYRSGWLDGRHAMVRALSEALHRGYDLDDWLRAELERDMAIFSGQGLGGAEDASEG